MRFACEGGSRVNFIFDTITPVHELVIVIADLYLPRERRSASGDAAGFEHLRGIPSVARYGARVRLADGWRTWLLGRIGRADLEDAAPACIAAAALDRGLGAAPAEPHATAVTRWIATAVHLHAGLTRVHLDQRGLLRLTPAEQAILAVDFTRTFGSSNHTLAPLPSGEFLLSTPGLTPLATEEPARSAGGELDQLMPTGPAATPLRRLLAEIEMWLHALPLNEARRSRGEAPVTALWPWGAAGRIVRPEYRAQSELPPAFGRDAWLEGLWRLNGAACHTPPQHLDEVLAAGTRAAVLVVEVGGQLRGDEATAAGALRRVDERFVSPALQALRRGALDGLSVILNDARAHVVRGSLRKFWRRTLRGLEGFT
jgi:hypothetical protein